MYVSRGLAARQPIAPGGVRLWGRFRVRGGGVLPPRTIPRTFRGYLLGRYTCAAAFRVALAHCVLGVPVRLLRVSRPPALCSVCPLESVRRGLGSLMYRGRVVSISVHCRKRRRYPLVIPCFAVHAECRSSGSTQLDLLLGEFGVKFGSQLAQ